MVDPNSVKIGDIVSIFITGMIGKYTGEVIEFREHDGSPVIKVEEHGPFARLKTGDYILLELVERRRSI